MHISIGPREHEQGTVTAFIGTRPDRMYQWSTIPAGVLIHVEMNATAAMIRHDGPRPAFHCETRPKGIYAL